MTKGRASRGDARGLILLQIPRPVDPEFGAPVISCQYDIVLDDDDSEENTYDDMGRSSGVDSEMQTREEDSISSRTASMSSGQGGTSNVTSTVSDLRTSLRLKGIGALHKSLGSPLDPELDTPARAGPSEVIMDGAECECEMQLPAEDMMSPTRSSMSSADGGDFFSTSVVSDLRTALRRKGGGTLNRMHSSLTQRHESNTSELLGGSRIESPCLHTMALRNGWDGGMQQPMQFHAPANGGMQLPTQVHAQAKVSKGVMPGFRSELRSDGFSTFGAMYGPAMPMHEKNDAHVNGGFRLKGSTLPRR